MNSDLLNQNKILQDLEKMYKLALKNDNLSLALKAKELQAKELNLLQKSNNQFNFDFSNMSVTDIEKIIKNIEEILQNEQNLKNN